MKLVLLAAALLACSFAEATSPKTGKLFGHVDVGPISPLERPGSPSKVPPAMYKPYTITVSQPGPHNEHMKSHAIRFVVSLKLSRVGDFSTNLAPGEYQVSITSETPSRRMPTPQTVKIVAGKTTRIEMKVDTGIR